MSDGTCAAKKQPELADAIDRLISQSDSILCRAEVVLSRIKPEPVETSEKGDCRDAGHLTRISTVHETLDRAIARLEIIEGLV